MAILRIWRRRDSEPDALAPLVLADEGLTEGLRDDRVDGLSQIDLFEGMTAEQLEILEPLAMPMHISAGQQLVQAGDRGDLLFAILDGKAQLYASSSVGQVTVRIAGPGESFPLATLIGDGVLISSVDALTDMDLLALSKTNLVKLCNERTDIGMHVYQRVAGILGGRYKKTLGVLTKTSEHALREADFFANV